jgi:hypothetical protein
MDLPDSVAVDLGSIFGKWLAGLVRTDFKDDAAWDAVVAAATARVWMSPTESAVATVQVVDDRRFEGFEAVDFLALTPRPNYLIFVVDAFALDHAEHPVLAIDTYERPGRTFRTLPYTLFEITANVLEANMDFSEFADSVGEDRIFRGFDILSP